MRARRSFLMVCLAVALGGCEPIGGVVATEPAAPPAAPVAAKPVPRSEASLELESYFARVERGLLSRGLLRGDGGGPDVPFSDRDLELNFRTVAFNQEYSTVGANIVQRTGASVLRRWNGPVLIEPVFGATMLPAEQERDRVAIEKLAHRLARITNHPVRAVERGGNFRVLILHEQERRDIGPRLRALLPEIQSAEIRAIEALPRETYCVLVSSDPGNNGVLTRAVAIIRAELPPALRVSCIHEEIAQGMGLPNDSPSARPSLFNDDDEFGRLTTQDEMMLQMLYDARLKPGMSEDEARDIVREMATALLAPAF